jgi:tetratricopeptide (TPR) repeat protein
MTLLDRHDREHLWRRAMLYRQNRRHAEAARLLEKLAENEPSAELYSLLAGEHRSAGDLRAALAAYKRSVQLDDSYLPSLFGLASLQTELGNHAQAAKIYAFALNRCPDMPQAYVNLGNAFARQGVLDEAEYCYLKAFALAADFGECDRAYYNLARVYALTDRPRLAVEALVESAKRDPARAVDALFDGVFADLHDHEDLELVVALGERRLYQGLRALLEAQKADELRQRIAASPILPGIIRARKSFACFRMFLPRPGISP